MSMFGVIAFQKIDQKLRKILNCRHFAFGGKSICLVGDFFQLNPVQDTPLYKDVEAIPSGHTKLAITMYKELFTTAILLTQNMRQQEDPEFANILDALQKPPILNDITDLLNQRCCPIPISAPWSPIAVQSNKVRSEIIIDHAQEAARLHTFDPQ